MITNEGNNSIGRTLANYLGTHIVVGVGSGAEIPERDSLEFETYRAEVRVRSYDPTTKRLVFAATLPDSVVMNIAEVGLVSSANNTASESLVSSFDPAAEEWTGGTEASDNMRVGESGMTVALGTMSTVFNGRSALANAKASDTVQVAYFGAGGNVEVRFGNSDADYFSFSFPVGAGYRVASEQISQMTKTGAPDMSSITELTIIHSGSGSVTMDAIRVNSIEDNESLIVRQVFSELYRKSAGVPLDIEVPMYIDMGGATQA